MITQFLNSGSVNYTLAKRSSGKDFIHRRLMLELLAPRATKKMTGVRGRSVWN